jgi:hypothetical protein
MFSVPLIFILLQLLVKNLPYSSLIFTITAAFNKPVSSFNNWLQQAEDTVPFLFQTEGLFASTLFKLFA